MSKFLDFFNKFEVSPFAAFFILITLATNSYKLFFIYFLLTFIHELGHVIAASLLGLKIDKIKLLPIGFNAEIAELDYTSSIKEFIIALAGPLTYFISIGILNFLYQIDFISYNAFIQSKIVNKYELFFNLLPIIPLDGGRILKVITDNFFTSKKSLYIVSILSMIFTIVFIYETIYSPQWLIYVFLITTNIFFFVTIHKKWRIFLLKRLLIKNNLKIKFHNQNDIYRNKNNYFIRNKKIIGEKEGIMRLIHGNKI